MTLTVTEKPLYGRRPVDAGRGILSPAAREAAAGPASTCTALKVLARPAAASPERRVAPPTGPRGTSVFIRGHPSHP